MGRKLECAAVAAFLLVVTASAAGAQNTCMLEGVTYPENAVVCSGGLALFCANGTWQNNEGARCDATSGSYLGPRRPLQERNPEAVPDFYKEKYPSLNLQ
jgi:hypothetical protein